MKRFLWFVLVAVLLAVTAWQLLREPDPAAILAGIEPPPAPVRSAAEELATFRVAPGFRVELVASEPLVVDPVAMDWDDAGRLYVVEMRGFMPDIDGRGEEQPTGRVVVLEDTDADGRMDRSELFLGQLVLPRAVAVLPEGVLIGVPPDLLLCSVVHDRQGIPRCGEKRRLTHYATSGGNVEHAENRLLPSLDGWIYNAKSSRRFRLRHSEFEIEQTVARGQWGIAQDDDGRLYQNHNSGWLYVDTFPAEYTLRQPAVAARLQKLGINVELAGGEEVFGVRVAPGLNRADLPESLRRDGRQKLPTAVSGLAIQRGDQFGEAYVGDAFVPESAGAAVAHFQIDREGAALRAQHRLYPDEDYGEREFLAATDERFRPVDARVGPDGALWIIDMYRGVIQHASFVSDHLRDYVARQGLEAPGATGRIWRVVREDRPITYPPPSLDTLEDQLAGLDHPNGWVRDRAQRRIVFDNAPGAVAALRRLEEFTLSGRKHALWALDALGAIDPATLRSAVADRDPAVRSLGLRVGESLLPGPTFLLAERLLVDPDPSVRLQALHTLGGVPVDERRAGILVRVGRTGSPLDRQAALSGLTGFESPALVTELEGAERARSDWLQELATAAHFSSSNEASGETWLLDLILEQAGTAGALSMLRGIEFAQQLPGNQRVVLATPHPLFEDETHDADLEQAVARVRRGFTWPGDPRPGGARALTQVEESLRERGEQLFKQTCASCHGAHGGGTPGLAPSLIASPWVRDADAWLVRIALQGVQGPILIDDEEWNLAMPGHGLDPRFDDASLAGLLTYLRRSFGHADSPVSPETVARIRAETRGRRTPWSVDELLALPITHRLDRYVGVYRVPIVGMELVLAREGPVLALGRRAGDRSPLTEQSEGVFSGAGLTLRFDPSAEGPAKEAEVHYETNTFTVSRVNP